jgi:tetratricopeptide (TPR) repeat protein
LGGLSPDQFGEALVNRARARLQIGMLDEAEADLRDAEQGAMDLAEVYALWGDVMLSRDDMAQARDKYAKARQLNPKIALPEKLRK